MKVIPNPIPPQSAVKKVQQDGWTDFFFGKAQGSELGNSSILDGETKVALHYRKEDAFDLVELKRPDQAISHRLWHSFKRSLCKASAPRYRR